MKKAIFYTTAAIALTIVIIVTYAAYSTYRLSDRMEAISTRIETVNFFIKDVEKDINKGVYISGFRTLLSFTQFISTNGTYISDVNGKFKEAFLNGTINNQPLSLMKDSTFTDWANKISAQADKIDIQFSFAINDVKLNHTDPWNLEIGLDITLDIRDKKNTSYWIRDRYLTTKISILGLEDPLYIVNSKGRIASTIVITNITSFVVNADTSNLVLHMNQSYYIAHADSPSYLMRLQGNLGNSSYGIESLVNLEKFQKQGIVIKDRSIVDSVYFGTGNTVNYRINKTPEWFKIDAAHLDFYQVINSTI
ncbi:hypothetical protein HYS31_06465 [Candidatus Woesearchaeota archaeon]|nr:hypothetical protein [Candidatus Woesearchaeota archaeon]